jgi:hypothetical protein
LFGRQFFCTSKTPLITFAPFELLHIPQRNRVSSNQCRCRFEGRICRRAPNPLYKMGSNTPLRTAWLPCGTACRRQSDSPSRCSCSSSRSLATRRCCATSLPPPQCSDPARTSSSGLGRSSIVTPARARTSLTLPGSMPRTTCSPWTAPTGTGADVGENFNFAFLVGRLVRIGLPQCVRLGVPGHAWLNKRGCKSV